MKRFEFITFVQAGALVFLLTLLPSAALGRSKLPLWFTNSDVVFVATSQGQAVAITEVFKAVKPFRFSDWAARYFPKPAQGLESAPQSYLVLVKIPVSTGASQQVLLSVSQYSIVNDVVCVDNETYTLLDLRIALAIQ